MGFWGLEVKPGKPQAYRPKDEQGKLHLTQATLGAGLGKEKSVIQCSIGDGTPVYLCSLLPNKTECCPLNLEFDDDDESVVFSVTGDRSIHLSGYLEAYEEEYDHDEDDDSDGIDIGESASGESSDYDSEDDEYDFLDSNLEMYQRSSVPNSGVVIEEIEDEEEPAKDNKTKRPKKKSQEENAKTQIIYKDSAHVPVLESEDEDGFPIPKGKEVEPENKTGGNDEQGSNKKRKSKASEQDGVQESVNKKKKKKNQKEKKEEEEEAAEQIQTPNGTVNNAMAESSETPDTSAKKKNKKKKKKNPNEEATVESKTTVEKQKSEEKKVNSKSSHVRTYPNGLIVEEVAMGKPNGKKAVPGATVTVRYVGKLQKNGKQFDCNLRGYKFRLGCGLVIKGWDVGVNGMRVGDKRKLTIPPSMGYGQKGAGGDIPPNAWLEFDVELVDVR